MLRFAGVGGDEAAVQATSSWSALLRRLVVGRPEIPVSSPSEGRRHKTNEFKVTETTKGLFSYEV